MLKQVYQSYKSIERDIFYLLVAEFFVQLVNASFYLIFNIYLTKKGYSDPEIADFTSYRFLAVMLLVVPLGFYIKGKPLRPMFNLSSAGVPAFSLLILFSVEMGMEWLTYTGLILWGLSFTFFQVASLPYILRNANPDTHSEAIALNYTAWSLSMLVGGVMIFLLSKLSPDFFDERVLLTIASLSGFFALYFMRKVKGKEVLPEVTTNKMQDIKNFDWMLITKALSPTFIIAVGAGLTIPFINLFFFHVFNVDSHAFSLMGSFTGVLVLFASLAVPFIKKKYGYKIAITLSQVLAVVILVLLALTEHYSYLSFALIAAIFLYVIRQPLMSMAAPMTSELTMYYVGPANQEIASAITSALWSGSWFFSSQIFRYLRSGGWSYGNIFLITAALYGFGVLLYYLLILDYERKKAYEISTI